jgi:glucosamine kinase
MSVNYTDNNTLYVGIDGGGSKCRATIVRSTGELLGSGVAGPANPFQDTAQALTSITGSVHLALEDAGLEQAAIHGLIAGVGLAGVNLPRFYDIINTWDHPFTHLFLTTDLHIACLGAHGGQDGAVLVAGTGSCGYFHAGGRSFICGAHGFPFGDKGSGAWIGLEAIKKALLALDGLGPTTTLEQRISAQLQTDSLGIIEKMAGATSNHYAKLAPLVFTAAAEGDVVAEGILVEGAAYLEAVASKLSAAAPPRMSLLGGLGKYILPRFSAELQALLTPALQGPEQGAVYYAQKQYQALTNPAEVRIDQT